MSSLHSADMDAATLGKPSHLGMSPPSSRRRSESAIIMHLADGFAYCDDLLAQSSRATQAQLALSS